jgi:hypothetical protein
MICSAGVLTRWITALMVLSLVSSAVSQDKLPPELNDKPANGTVLDLSVPESPAFAVLGLTPQEVIRPSNPSSFVSQLLNGVDPRGNLQTGIAIDTHPYLLFYGNQITLKDYVTSTPTRLLARTQLSLATAKGASDDDKAIRLALGLHLTPWDKGDPRIDKNLWDCFRSNLRSPEAEALADEIADLKEKMAEATTEADRQQIQQQIERKEQALDQLTNQPAKKCREAARARLWNASSWSLGIAPTWLSPTGSIDDLQWNSASFWSSLAYGFDGIPGLQRSSQFLIGVRYNLDEMVPAPGPDAGGKFIKQDTLVVGLRLRLVGYRPESISAPTLIFSLEGDYFYADRKGLSNDSSYRVSLGADYKIPNTENLYVKLSIGGSGGVDKDDGQMFIITTLRYGF